VLDEIASLVEQNAERIARIPALVQTQVEGSRATGQLVDRIEQVAEANATAAMEVTATVQHQAAAMQEMADSAYGLSRIAEELNRRVAKFQFRQGEVKR
jgi:methyl-accepting chemotaxis protein